eukprot:m.44128 g.44128  ORF g.44128 m.44128 type:complete len:170 (+) comp12084_c0_seq3:872-1381(+)
MCRCTSSYFFILFECFTGLFHKPACLLCFLATVLPNACLQLPLQLSLIVGQVLDGFEQWKQMVHLLCSCDEAIVKYPDLYLNFLNAIRYQMEQTPPDFFVDIVTSNNFLVQALQSLFLRIREADGARPDVRAEAEKLKTKLTAHFGWSFESGEDDEDDEDGPTVVHMDE